MNIGFMGVMRVAGEEENPGRRFTPFPAWRYLA
jgi:hypothetical protein